jgi:tetratricopeptide (TPR) repeat protein
MKGRVIKVTQRDSALYLLNITLQSGVVMVLMILGLGLIIFMILLKSPKQKELGDLPGNGLPAPPDANTSFLDHMNQGNSMLAQYEYDKALEHFQAALKLKSSEPSVHFKIGRVFLQKEDYRNSINAFRNALNLNPGMVEAHFELARIFQIQKNSEHAHQELNQALNIKPEHEDTLKLKVKLFEEAENYQEAIPFLRKLISISRSPLKYRTTLAEYLNKLGQQEEAVSEYFSLIETDPANRLHYQGKIGQAYFDQEHYSKAIEYFKMVLQEQSQIKDQDYLLIIKSQMAAALCNEGVKRFEVNDYTNAIQHYEEALLYDNANPDIHYNLGKALARTSDTARSLQHFQLATTLQPQDIGSYYEMAILQDEKGMFEEAMANYHKVLELDPRHLNATFGLGTLHGVQGNMDEAIQYLTAAISINPEFVDAIYNLGVALERKKEFAKAVKMYKKVVSLDPNHEKAKSNLAHIQHMKS